MQRALNERWRRPALAWKSAAEIWRERPSFDVDGRNFATKSKHCRASCSAARRANKMTRRPRDTSRHRARARHLGYLRIENRRPVLGDNRSRNKRSSWRVTGISIGRGADRFWGDGRDVWLDSFSEYMSERRKDGDTVATFPGRECHCVLGQSGCWGSSSQCDARRITLVSGIEGRWNVGVEPASVDRRH